MASYGKIFCISLVYSFIILALVGGAVTVNLVRLKELKKLEQDYNSTIINITGFTVVSGKCFFCDKLRSVRVAPPLEPPDCDYIQAYIAHALVSYFAYVNHSISLYSGVTKSDQWCGMTPDAAIEGAISYYGNTGSSYSGYYLISNPDIWLWKLPGSSAYLNGMLALFITIGIISGIAISNIGCMCYRKRVESRGYQPINGVFIRPGENIITGVVVE